jgi:uncharacterized membrane protein
VNRVLARAVFYDPLFFASRLLGMKKSSYKRYRMFYVQNGVFILVALTSMFGT